MFGSEKKQMVQICGLQRCGATGNPHYMHFSEARSNWWKEAEKLPINPVLQPLPAE